MNHPLYIRMEEEIVRLKETGNFRRFFSGVTEQKFITLDGVKMLNFSSNDYLGLATDNSLREEFFSSLDTTHSYLSSSSSRLLTGNTHYYDELEHLIAELYGKESAVVFSSGYHLNSGLLPAISSKETLILSDKLVHASLIDGIRLTVAKHLRYRHNDYAHLRQLLSANAANHDTVIIVTESIFSMDGDMADVKELVAIKKEYANVLLYIDEAHAVGAWGPTGLGVCETEKVIPEIDFLVGTFGKALASHGAFVVCSKIVGEYLTNKMRTLLFTTALPPLNVAWSLFLMQRMASFSERRKQLAEVSMLFRNLLRKHGMETPSASYIIPYVIGDSRDAVLKSKELQRKGFFALPVRPPTVPEGTSRIRFSITSDLECQDIERLIEEIIKA